MNDTTQVQHRTTRKRQITGDALLQATEAGTETLPRPGPKASQRAEARRRAMLDAAYQLFTTKGLQHTSLDDVIALSGGSRSTLYEMFGNKDGLFEEMLREHCESMMGPVFELTLTGHHPREVLCQFANAFLDKIYSEESLRSIRRIMQEALHYPETADFFRRAPNMVKLRLGAYLRRMTDEGHLRIENPDEAAELFLLMVEGPWSPLRFASGEIPAPDALRKHAHRAVEIFLKGTLAQARADG